MLNIKKSHPARQMHDTFYVKNKRKVLRTHTSPVQIRGMLESKPPFAFSSAGKVYRKDDDATHLPMFHQVEGIYVDVDVNFANLKDHINQILLDYLVKMLKQDLDHHIFHLQNHQQKWIFISESNKWLEILGCGIVNPIVLKIVILIQTI